MTISILFCIFFITLFAVIFDATADSLRDHKELGLSHFMEAMAVVMFLCLAKVIGDMTWAAFLFVPFGFYVANRLLFFDIIYNIVSDNPIAYVGDSAWYDQIISFIFKRTNPMMLLWARVVIWVVYCGTVFFFEY